jgi:DMSO/TMAO reductase YedYZ molybdopterin-dependent catalytic subunit
MFHSLYNRSVGSSTPTAEPTEKGGDKIFLNWPASYLDGFEAFDTDHWQLEVGGLVEKPQAFTLKDLNNFMRIQQNRRLVFADGWTYRSTWEGFVVQELLHRVVPKPEAQYLIQTNMAGHTECMPLKDLYSQRALFCLRVSGKSLPSLYGGPLRLLVFDRYAHKGLGQLTHLELAEHPVPGHFASKGYNPEAPIEPGDYYAADLGSMQSAKAPGEITQW